MAIGGAPVGFEKAECFPAIFWRSSDSSMSCRFVTDRKYGPKIRQPKRKAAT